MQLRKLGWLCVLETWRVTGLLLSAALVVQKAALQVVLGQSRMTGAEAREVPGHVVSRVQAPPGFLQAVGWVQGTRDQQELFTCGSAPLPLSTPRLYS